MEEKIASSDVQVKVANEIPKEATILEVEGKKEQEKTKIDKSKITIDQKDYSWLKKSQYESHREKYTTTYVLQHKKYPSKIVELRAASPIHACQMIHWKPNQVRVLDTITEECSDVMDTISQLSYGLAKASISGSTSVS